MKPQAKYKIRRLRTHWWTTYVWTDAFGYLPISFAYDGASAISRFNQRSRYKGGLA